MSVKALMAGVKASVLTPRGPSSAHVLLNLFFRQMEELVVKEEVDLTPAEVLVVPLIMGVVVMDVINSLHPSSVYVHQDLHCQVIIRLVFQTIKVLIQVLIQDFQ